METVSLIIMFIGLLALVALYLLSRLSRRNLPRKHDEAVPVLRDSTGKELSTVLEDSPARDGKRPSANARTLSDTLMSGVAKSAASAPPTAAPAPQVTLPPQIVLFVAADTGAGFAGNDVLNALENAGLSFGEMGIFHRMVLTDAGEASLFNVANGVKPWTLVPEEMADHVTPGLSLILNLPGPIDNQEAIHDFVRTAERLATDLGGVVKDQEQQPLTPESRAHLLATAR